MILKYKDYIGNVEIDPEENLLHGRVLGIRDVITFEGQTPQQIAKAFEDSVEDYLAFCKSRGQEPNTPFSGKFVVRVAPELHRTISTLAEASGMSLNSWISNRLATDPEARSGLHLLHKAKQPAKAPVKAKRSRQRVRYLTGT